MNASQRRQEIRDRKSITNRKARLWSKDQWEDFDIYRVPVDALLLNIDNHRFAAERTLFESRLGHSFDPENSENDELSIISILLDTGQDVDGEVVKGNSTIDTESLKIDWQKRKQATPFWIRPDGIVRNGNRRLAMLKRMRRDGLSGTEWVEAIILPTDEYSEHDVFEMEQREQLTEDFKVRYTDINRLITIKRAAVGRDVDWFDEESIKKVAGEIQEVTGGGPSYALEQLRAIKFMDAFLEDESASGQYHKLMRRVERFRDVGKTMATIESDYPDDAPDMLRLLFAAVRAGNTHQDIRSIRRIFIDDRDRFDKLRQQIDSTEEEWDQPDEDSIPDPDLSVLSSSDSENTDDDEPEVPLVDPRTSNYPVELVKRAIKNSIDGFDARNLDVISKLVQIESRVDDLRKAGDQLAESLQGSHAQEARTKLNNIVEWADDVRHLLK